MLSETLTRMMHFVTEGGRIALENRAKGLNVTHKDGDLLQMLTQTDTEISGVAQKFFGNQLVSEETFKGEAAFASACTMLRSDTGCFVVDEVDGTKPYGGQLAQWGIMVGACRNGRPYAGAIHLPALVDGWQVWCDRLNPDVQKGVLILAENGRVWVAPTEGGRVVGEVRPYTRPKVTTYHTGWVGASGEGYGLDYSKGLFAMGDSCYAADFARLILARSDTTTFAGKLWDMAAGFAAIEACGFNWYRYPDLAELPADMTTLFKPNFNIRDMWLIAPDKKLAETLASALRPNR